MKLVLKSCAAAVAGAITAVVLIMFVEWLSSLLHPMPPDMDSSDPAQMAAFVQTLPLSAFLMVLLAWTVGAFAGAAVARRLAPQRRVVPALIVCVLLLIGTVVTLVEIPHPLWFAIVGIVTIIVSGALGIAISGGTSVFTTKREINAPLESVFSTIARISEFSKAVPGIVKVDFLTDQHYGVGTRFKETRLMNGREAATELEVTELVENDRIRLISDAGGTIWDTVFTTKTDGDHVLMEMVMDVRPYRLLSKLMTPMIMGMVAKAIESDMDQVKQFCEQQSGKI